MRRFGFIRPASLSRLVCDEANEWARYPKLRQSKPWPPFTRPFFTVSPFRQEMVRRAIHLTDRDAYTLSVLYSYGVGEKIVSVGSSDPLTSIRVARTPDDPTTGSLAIVRAQLSPRPSPLCGAAVTGCLVLFIAFFAIGPGVVVWLTLSELMPTRIRSKGMGMALLLNQGVSTASAAAFLLVVGLMRTQPC